MSGSLELELQVGSLVRELPLQPSLVVSMPGSYRVAIVRTVLQRC